MSTAEYHRLYSREHYARNKEKYKEKARTHVRKMMALLIELKHMKPCVDCGIPYPYYVMDFDHRDPLLKLDAVRRFVTLAKERLMAEIAKCDLVCSNCHRQRTYGRVVE